MIDILPVKPPPCICGRGKFYHPWRFCDNYTPVTSSDVESMKDEQTQNVLKELREFQSLARVTGSVIDDICKMAIKEIERLTGNCHCKVEHHIAVKYLDCPIHGNKVS